MHSDLHRRAGRAAAHFFVAIAGPGASFVCAPATAQTLSLSTGPEFSTGDFGADENSDLLLTGLTARLSGKAGSVSLSTAYARLSDVSTLVTTGVGGVEVTPDADGSTSGFTDLVIGLSRTFVAENPNAPIVTLSGSVKLPTANEAEGLTSGAVDYSIRTEIMRDIGPIIGFASIGARLRGESDVVDVSNSVLAGAGFQKSLGDKSATAISYDYRGNAIVGGPDAHEVTALYFHRFTDRLSLAAYAYTGFTDASPDIGFGFTISRKFWSKK